MPLPGILTSLKYTSYTYPSVECHPGGGYRPATFSNGISRTSGKSLRSSLGVLLGASCPSDMHPGILLARFGSTDAPGLEMDEETVFALAVFQVFGCCLAEGGVGQQRREA